MKQIKLVCIAVISSTLTACATSTADLRQDVSPGSLAGIWDVALYFSADAPPSQTVMELASVNDDGTLEGSFYQSDFEQARYRVQGSEFIISAVTSDGSGPYATSGRLTAPGIIEGQTLSTGRDFLMAWTATKRTPEK